VARVVSVRNSANPVFAACRSAISSCVRSGRPFQISARELYDTMVEVSGYSGGDIKYYDPIRYTLGPIILDVREADSEMPDPYYSGHIPGAMHVPWREIVSQRTLLCLSRDRKIVLYSGNGQTGSLAAAILGVLGYDAVNLKWGITSWTSDSDAAPGRYSLSRDTIWNEDQPIGQSPASGLHFESALRSIPAMPNTAIRNSLG